METTPVKRADLAALVDRLRAHRDGGGPWQEWTPATPEPDGVISLGYPTPAPVVAEAMRFLHTHGFIGFDWPNWQAGRDLYAELTPERVATLDRQTTLMLLSALAREERFCDGIWGLMFESGRGTWLFERWLELTPPDSSEGELDGH